MRKSTALLIIGIVFFLGIEANKILSQNDTPSASSRIPAVMRLLFNRVIVSRKSNGPLIGLLIGVENNSLVIKIKEDEHLIPYNDLTKIVIEDEKSTGSNILYGMLGGAYLGNLIFDRAKNQPPVFIGAGNETTLWFFFKNAIYASAGGAIVYLGNLVTKKGEREFIFPEDQIKRLKMWEKLKRFITGFEQQPGKFHLSLQACHVYTPIRDWYADVFPDSYNYSEAMRINLLRKIHLTYSIRQDLEVGAAWIGIGEPAYYGYNWQSRGSSWFNMYKDDYGFYAVVIYKPFDHILSSKMDWGIGGGLGAAKVDLVFGAGTSSGYPDYIENEQEHKISEVKFSGVLFSHIVYNLSRLFSFGLYGDYVYIHPERIPEFPNVNIPGKKFNLGNASVGLSFGINF